MDLLVSWGRAEWFAILVYPFFLMASDWGFAIYVIIRRRVLLASGATPQKIV